MMEDAIAGGPGLSPEEQAAAAEEAAEAKTAANDAAQAAAESEAHEGSDLPAEGDPGSDERNPAADQAPVATEAQEAIIGDQGSRDEQQPQPSVGSQDIPNRTSAPPPEAQSGVALPEDRAAGVQPGGEGQE